MRLYVHHLLGTLDPLRRAFERPIAMACFRLFRAYDSSRFSDCPKSVVIAFERSYLSVRVLAQL